MEKRSGVEKAWQIYMDDGLGGAVALRDTVADTRGPRSLASCDL